MSRLLVTQARGKDRYDSPIDYLEDSFVHFFSSINIDMYPVPNGLKNINRFLLGIEYDGLVISGGADVNPKYFSEIEYKSHRYSDKRDSIETALIDLCVEEEKMILGVCYGMQKLNIYFGGNITSNNHLSVCDDNKPLDHHAILIKKPIFDFQGEYLVNQFHNNTIEQEDLAIDLNVVAIDSTFGNIEAFVHNRLPILGIQWHPDRKSPDPGFNKQFISTFLRNNFSSES